MKRVLFLANHALGLYNFRLELIESLLKEGHEVHVSSPNGECIDKLVSLGVIYHEIEFDRHGMNPINEYKIYKHYKKLLHQVKPDICLGYTIKPNVYGAMAANKLKIPFVANITGLGTAVESGGLSAELIVLLYKMAFGTRHGKIQRVFFQNEENELFFKKKKIALDKHAIIPGSGVNIERFPATVLPACGDGISGEPVKFAFISRIMAEKGIDIYLEAARNIKKDFPRTEFHIGGFFEPEYNRNLFDECVREGVVVYDGVIKDVAGFMSNIHCIVHPTYYPEGLSNVLLEASSCGRPIITTDRSGCREVCVDGVNGYLISEQSIEDLTNGIRDFLNSSFENKQLMGRNGRMLIEKRFNRQIVVDAYFSEINSD